MKGGRGRKWILCKEGSSYSDGSLNPEYIWKGKKRHEEGSESKDFEYQRIIGGGVLAKERESWRQVVMEECDV